MNRPNDSARDTDVLAALRTATASRHERLDSGLPLSAPLPDLADYAAHLTMVRDWLAPLEAWLAGFDDGPQRDPTLPPTARLALIEADLAEPGMVDTPPRAPASWPSDASAAYRWGVAYVIEGSQLGGAVLYGKLVGPLAPHPLRYLRGLDVGPGPRWRAFMQALRAHVTSQEQIADACAGACDAFDAILALAPLDKQ
ncbi:biliverdin-producing heme oxygenase [Massilia sp. IC2-476]|uniref:biliverdin-producing heme oxygenase n=1 Tax=Massilia sp. IC2-476 TaxID=2887199 RepID=UPI001D1019EA|nr:biliverdin-producing heme oxygenase [Massilia sp. IC2-476]MCC2970789.1 biliverdin-producing heme oxygenase [Massilia sp. IC2-476]